MGVPINAWEINSDLWLGSRYMLTNDSETIDQYCPSGYLIRLVSEKFLEQEKLQKSKKYDKLQFFMPTAIFEELKIEIICGK